MRVPRPRIPCSRYAPCWLRLGHYATSAVVHHAQNMVFQHQTEPEIPPVQRKLRFFNFYSIFPPITSSPERSRLRFKHTGELCCFQVSCFFKGNLTFHNPLEYQQKRKCLWPAERHEFNGSRDIRPKPISRSLEKRFMTSFTHLRSHSNGKSGLATPKVMPFELVSSALAPEIQIFRVSDSQHLRFLDFQTLRPCSDHNIPIP